MFNYIRIIPRLKHDLNDPFSYSCNVAIIMLFGLTYLMQFIYGWLVVVGGVLVGLMGQVGVVGLAVAAVVLMLLALLTAPLVVVVVMVMVVVVVVVAVALPYPPPTTTPDHTHTHTTTPARPPTHAPTRPPTHPPSHPPEHSCVYMIADLAAWRTGGGRVNARTSRRYKRGWAGRAGGLRTSSCPWVGRSTTTANIQLATLAAASHPFRRSPSG